MAHVNILSLPIEVIQEIGNVRLTRVQSTFRSVFVWVTYRSQLLPGLQDGQDRDSLKTLRLVCSQFNHAFEAQVLSTLVILVTFHTLPQSLDMLWTFASQSRAASRAIQHARTLKIKYLSPVMILDPELVRVPQHESESRPMPPTSSPRILKRRLASAISFLKRPFKWVRNFLYSSRPLNMSLDQGISWRRVTCILLCGNT